MNISEAQRPRSTRRPPFAVAWLAVAAVLLNVAIASLHIVGMVRAGLAGGLTDGGAAAVLCLPSQTPDGNGFGGGEGQRTFAAVCLLCATLAGGASLPAARDGVAAPDPTVSRAYRGMLRADRHVVRPERLSKRSRAPPTGAA